MRLRKWALGIVGALATALLLATDASFDLFTTSDSTNTVAAAGRSPKGTVKIRTNIALPNGESISPPPSGEALEIRHKNGSRAELLMNRRDGSLEHHLWYNEDGTTISKAERFAGDGKIVRRLEVDGDELTTTTFYSDGEHEYSIVVANRHFGDLTYTYNYPDGTPALEQSYNGEGILVSETVYDENGSRLRQRIMFGDDSISLTYSDTDVEFTQSWSDLDATAGPKLQLSFGEGDEHHDVEIQFAPDARRMVTITEQQTDGTKTVDTLSGDATSVAMRQWVDLDGKVTRTERFTRNGPAPLSIPPEMLRLPPGAATPPAFR